MTPDQAREVLARRLVELTENEPLAVHLRQGDAPARAIDEEVGAFQPTTEVPAAVPVNEDPEEIRAALQHLDLGTWGACTSCGAPIDAERLTRAPYTRLCASCA